MTLRETKLLADENLHPDVVAWLQGEGFDVLDVKTDGLIGATDLVILYRAASEQRVVVTQDRDFGRLAVAQQQPYHGILYLRPGHISAATTIAALQAVLDSEIEVTPPFILIAEHTESTVKMRLRQ
ncbi:MAG: DUF5615 family PIN-like protein [Bacteroidota bacterium]